jgi:adenylate cyclase
MARVFLSYARADADAAEQLAAGLARRGHQVWWDRDLEGGSHFTKAIERELHEADAVVVLWSASSIESSWVLDEAAEGRDTGRLIPVNLRGARPPLGFRQYQSLPLDDWFERPTEEQQLQLVLRAVERLGPIEASASEPNSRRKAVSGPSICVLPFTNISGDPEQEYFSDGITEDVIIDLSKISALSVVARNTAFMFKDKTEDVEEVARTLGVTHVLEGSVRKAGNRVRITAKLINGKAGDHLWAERFDRELTDIFAIQDEISRAIVDALRVKLLASEKDAIGKRGTSNIESYEYYLKGRQFFHNTTRSYLALARRMFEKAIELDSGYARAYAGMASCDTRLNEWYAGGIPTETILAIANKALEMDGALAEAYAARAAALADAEQHQEAEEAFNQALAVDPDSYDAIYAFGRFRMARGEFAQAADLYMRALEIEPDDYQAPLLAVTSLQMIGRIKEAGDYARIGLQHAREALRLHPESSRPAQLGACVLASFGEKDEAKEWLAQALAVDPEDNGARYNAACCLAQIGEPEEALDLLERWAEQRGSEGRRWMLVDPDLDSLRGHPRYKALAHE